MIPLLTSSTQLGLASPAWVGCTLMDPGRPGPEFRDLLDLGRPGDAPLDATAARSLVQAEQVGDGLPAAATLRERTGLPVPDGGAEWHADPAARFDSLGMFGRAGLSPMPHEAVRLRDVDPLPAPAADGALVERPSLTTTEPALAAGPGSMIGRAKDQASVPVGLSPQAEDTTGQAAGTALDDPRGQLVEDIFDEGERLALRASSVFLDPRERAPQFNLAAFVEAGALELVVRVGDLPPDDAVELHQRIEQVAGEQGLQLGVLTLNGKIVGISDEGGSHGHRAG